MSSQPYRREPDGNNKEVGGALSVRAYMIFTKKIVLNEPESSRHTQEGDIIPSRQRPKYDVLSVKEEQHQKKKKKGLTAEDESPFNSCTTVHHDK